MVSPAGLFKTNIDIYKYSETIDSGGSSGSDFTFLETIKSNVQPYKSEEAVKAGRKWSNSMLKIYIKATENIDMKDRVEYLGEKYDIIEKEIWIEKYMKLICSRTE